MSDVGFDVVSRGELHRLTDRVIEQMVRCCGELLKRLRSNIEASRTGMPQFEHLQFAIIEKLCINGEFHSSRSQGTLLITLRSTVSTMRKMKSL